MADAPAVRQRRWRAHKAGDHSMCSQSRCPAAGDALRVRLAERLDAMPVEVDPAAELTRLVRRLISASEQEPMNMALARELRATLLALPPAGQPDPVQQRQAVIMARRAARQAGLGDAGRPLVLVGKNERRPARRRQEVTDGE